MKTLNKYETLQDLDPASFVFVMATGIVSISLYINGWILLSNIFLGIGTLGYITLLLLFFLRSFWLAPIDFRKSKVLLELFKYLSFSAGTDALATHFAIRGSTTIALILGTIGAISAIILVYTIFCMLLFNTKESIQTVSPYWLLMAIAANSVGIVISSLWNQQAITNAIFIIIACCFWAFGIIIYLIFMTLNLYRMFFLPFKGEDLNPAFWTCLGGAAIAVVDGCSLILMNHVPQFLELIKPFIIGLSLLLWGWATALLPILIFMGMWKYFYFKVPIETVPSLWAVVFPLGMYSASIVYLSKSLQMEIIEGMGPLFLGIAVTAWIVVGIITRFNPINHQK